MKHMLMTASAFVLAISPTVANAKTYKKIDKGVGNCIFSTSALPKNKEDEFKVETNFKEGDDIHARCYFAKTIVDFTKDGKIRNSLRQAIGATIAEQQAGPAWWSEIRWTDDQNFWHRLRHAYIPSETGHWDQQRYDLPASNNPKECDWHQSKFNKPEDCVDVATETKNLGHNLKKSGTYTTEVCIVVMFDKVDKTKLVAGTDTDVVESQVMAKGCFNYTVEL